MCSTSFEPLEVKKLEFDAWSLLRHRSLSLHQSHWSLYLVSTLPCFYAIFLCNLLLLKPKKTVGYRISLVYFWCTKGKEIVGDALSKEEKMAFLPSTLYY
jgi:hypothetical protein